MGTRLQIGNAANLYEYWRDGIAEYINAELEALPEQERFVINCASQVPADGCLALRLLHAALRQRHSRGIAHGQHVALLSGTGVLQGGGREASGWASHQRCLSGQLDLSGAEAAACGLAGVSA